jgi:single-strand DNA-binding protein
VNTRKTRRPKATVEELRQALKDQPLVSSKGAAELLGVLPQNVMRLGDRMPASIAIAGAERTRIGRLTADPELRSLPSGTSVCSLRVAFSTSWKNSATGEWEDRPNYVSVTVWGNQGESVAKYMKKGRQIAVLGHLQWREWDANDGTKRQSLDIIAETVQFLGSKEGGGSGDGGSQSSDAGGFTPAAGGEQDDIPF